VAGQQLVLSSRGRPTGRAGWALLAAMVLTGLSMRTAAITIGPVLSDVEAGLGVTSAAAGLITTLPTVCFAAIGAVAPRLARHVGEHLLVVISMAVMTAGLVLRAVAGSLWPFLLASVLALCGGAITNVLMPSLVKRHYPDRIGPMTALYTTALAVGATAGSALTVPISDAAGGWRWGLGSWAVLSAVAVLPWLLMLRGDRPDAATSTHVAIWRLAGSPTAWALTVLFAGQSLQAYVAFGWFATFLRDHGVSETRSGILVAFYAALSIPTSALMPTLAVRGQRRLILGCCSCYLAGYVGLLVAPVGGAWVWMLLVGVGSGLFPLVLTMFSLRTRTADATVALAAFAQGVGYLLAGTGPLLVGVLLGRPHDWSAPFTMLFVVLGVTAVAGMFASRPRYVDDEVRGLARKVPLQ
jgi:MFS transporter, CP family, cyanate transporter